MGASSRDTCSSYSTSSSVSLKARSTNQSLADSNNGGGLPRKRIWKGGLFKASSRPSEDRYNPVGNPTLNNVASRISPVSPSQLSSGS
jgi:hypothetical protein